MGLDEAQAAEFQRLEEDLLRPEVRADRKRFSAMIAEDFVEFGSSGMVFTKVDVMSDLESLPDVALPLSDFSARELADGVALVTYRSVTRHPDGREMHALRSSVWVCIDDTWRMVFHQGTPAT